MDHDVARLSIAGAGDALRRREISVREIVAESLKRVAELDGALHSYTVVLEEAAMAEAAALDEALAQGRDLGPLHGIPMAVKDIFETRNAPTTMGSRLFEGYRAEEDSPAIIALRRAGVVLLGKLNMDEFALGVTGTSPLFPRCVNPIDPDRIAGGSSAGSGCATAAGLCVASLGTDTGGSTRVPAACCGVVGLKPTYGRVSKRGVLPLSWSLDHVGTLARSVTDAWLTLRAVAGPDEADPGSCLHAPELGHPQLEDDIRGLRVGLALSGIFSGADDEVTSAVRAAAETLDALGGRVSPVQIDTVVPRGIITTEASVLYAGELDGSPELFTDRVRGMLTAARDRPARAYAESRRAQDLLRRSFELLLEEVDVIITPTTPVAAPRFEDVDSGTVSGDLTRYTGPINLTGLPALSVPCGVTDGNLPVGMQIIGRRWEERQICVVGNAFEKAIKGQYALRRH